MLRESWAEVIRALCDGAEDGPTASMLHQCEYVAVNGNTITVNVSGEFVLTYIKKNLLTSMKAMLAEKAGHPVEIAFAIAPVAVPVQAVPAPSGDRNLFGDVEPGPDKRKFKSNLNSAFTFENYIRGKNNDYVVAVATQVALTPGTTHNPFFIHGGVGLGKTHILQAIGNRILERNPDKRVHYVGGGAFVTEFVDALMGKNPNKFKNKYRSLDVFLLDDIQLLQKAMQTSKELFEIYQELEQHGRQMVFVSDRPPRELQHLDERLVNRFEKNIVAFVEPPQYETRVAIIQRKLNDMGTSIEQDIIDHIAQNITTDVRKIEGALKSYIARRDLMGQTYTLAQCIDMEIFRDYFTKGNEVTSATVKEIIRAAGKAFNLPAETITGKERTRSIAYVRQLAMYLALELSGKSTTEVGSEFSRDHSTVVHSRQCIAEALKEEDHVAQDIEKIKYFLINS